MDFGTAAPSIGQEDGEQVEGQHCPVGNGCPSVPLPVEGEAEGCHNSIGGIGCGVHPDMGHMENGSTGGSGGVEQDEQLDGVGGEGCAQQRGEAGCTSAEDRKLFHDY